LNIKKYLNLIIRTILFSGFLLSIIVILFYKDVLFASQVGRFGSTIENSSEEVLSPIAIAYSGALNICLMLPLIFKNFNSYSFFKKIYYLTNFLLSMFLFVMGSTRGAFIVVILSVILYVYSQSGFKKIKYLIYLLPIVPLFYLYLEYTGS